MGPAGLECRSPVSAMPLLLAFPVGLGLLTNKGPVPVDDFVEWVERFEKCQGVLDFKAGSEVHCTRSNDPILEGVKNDDGIELGIRFPDEPLDVLLGVPAIIIATVGYDQQGSFSGVCPSHLTESQINGIE